MLRFDDESPEHSIYSGSIHSTSVREDPEYDEEFDEEDRFQPYSRRSSHKQSSYEPAFERGRAARERQNRQPRRRHNSCDGRRDAARAQQYGDMMRDSNITSSYLNSSDASLRRTPSQSSNLRKSKSFHRSNPHLDGGFSVDRRDLLSPPGSERGGYRDSRRERDRDADFDRHDARDERGVRFQRNKDPRGGRSMMDLRSNNRIDRSAMDLISRHQLGERYGERDREHTRSLKNLNRISQSIRDIRGTSEEDMELINA